MKNESEKKKSILESATKVFAEKRFADATISEIAKGAGLTGSGIYTYYTSKEEILFTIIENFLIESHSDLQEHLEGIHGAENKLRKAIWFHCKAYSGNKKEIKIVLESRSYPRFYQSNAYTALKIYAGLITEIIKEGIKEGVFCSLSSPMILRDMILGTIDHIAINWTIKNAANSLDQAETIFDMVMDSVRIGGKGKNRINKKDEKKVKIINVATALFAKKGFADTSMLEIAKKAGVAEGTVYEYFHNKENILIRIPHEKLSELYDTISGNAIERKIKEVISNIFQFYYNEKSYSTILVLMLRTNKKFHISKSSKIIDDLFGIIKDLIIKGQKEKIFKKDLNMEICRNLLFGTVDHILIPWIIFNRNYDLKGVGEEVAELFINAVKR
jgi:TetR/AcrR family fatty acid metabolism transcriptional regulator